MNNTTNISNHVQSGQRKTGAQSFLNEVQCDLIKHGQQEIREEMTEMKTNIMANYSLVYASTYESTDLSL